MDTNTDNEVTDHYAMLGIEPDATLEQIKAAWKDKSARHHPDKHPDDPEAGDRFRKMKEARDCLLDPIERYAYDTKRNAHDAQRQAATPSPESSENVEPGLVIFDEARAQESQRKSGERVLGGVHQPQRRSAQPSSNGWGWFAAAGLGIVGVTLAALAADRYAPVDKHVDRHRDPRTGQFRKGYLR